MRNALLTPLLLSISLLMPVAGHTATIDFEDGVGGDLTGSEVFSGLVTVSGNGKTLGLFNSNCRGNGSTQFSNRCTGGDTDLASGTAFGTDPQGLVLIIEENPGDGKPDDNADGGKITFNFLQAVHFGSISVLDLDRNFRDIMFDFVLGDGTTLFSIVPNAVTLLSTATDENSLRRFDFDVADVFSMSFSARDSFAVASLDVTPVPLPAGLPLLLGGLAGLAAFKRRKPLPV